MSTEFVSRVTRNLGFVRWGAGPTVGCRYEFGTITNWENVTSWVRAGDQFYPLGPSSMDSDPVTAEDFEQLVVTGRASFGEYPVTVAVGSGDIAKFETEE